MFRPLRICTWNAQGLERKGRELRWMVVNHDIDICLLSETKLAPDTPFAVQGYSLYRACHPYGLRRGGSAVLIKQSCIPHIILEPISINCEHSDDRAKRYMACLQIARIQLELYENVTYQIGAFYAPSGHAVLPKDFTWAFQQMGSHFLLGGDFNGHHESWDGDISNSNLAGKRLHKAIEEENLEIIAPKCYTHVPHHIGQKTSILDFFIGKNIKCMSNTPELFADSTSDHKPLLMKLGYDNTQYEGPVFTNISSSASVPRCDFNQLSGSLSQPFYLSESEGSVLGSLNPFLKSDQLRIGIPPVIRGLPTVQSNTGSFVTGSGHSSVLETQNLFRQPRVDENAASSMKTVACERLHVSTWDSQGLAGKEHEVFQYVEDMDILMISNTLPFPESLEIPGYEIFRADHPTSRNKGGSALLIRKSIDHCQLPSITEDFVQIARVAIRIDNKELQFGSAYFSPEYDDLPCEHYMDVFEELGTSSGFMVGGGFNAKHTHWNCTDYNNRGLQLFQLINLLHLDVLVPLRPTSYPETDQIEQTDFFIGKCIPNVVQPPQTLCDSSSEHKPIYVELST